VGDVVGHEHLAAHPVDADLDLVALVLPLTLAVRDLGVAHGSKPFLHICAIFLLTVATPGRGMTPPKTGRESTRPGAPVPSGSSPAAPASLRGGHAVPDVAEELPGAVLLPLPDDDVLDVLGLLRLVGRLDLQGRGAALDREVAGRLDVDGVERDRLDARIAGALPEGLDGGSPAGHLAVGRKRDRVLRVGRGDRRHVAAAE